MKLKQKLVALFTTTILMGGNILPVGSQVIAAAVADDLTNQDSNTNHENVEFNTYLEGNTHETTFKVDEGGKMYVELKIKENGYLKNGIVEFSDANYKIDVEAVKNSLNNKNEEAKSAEATNKEAQSTETVSQNSENEQTTIADYVQNVEENKIIFSKIESSEESNILELPIKIKKEENIEQDNFLKTSQVKFTGTYIDGTGTERQINKTINNKIGWVSEVEAEVTGEVTKYLPYKVGEEYGVLLQAKLNSKIKDSKLPISTSNIEVTAPVINEQKPERASVIVNTTKATNGEETGEKFTNENYSYNAETGAVTIEVKNEANDQGIISWKDGIDEYLVNYFYVGQNLYNDAKEKLAKAKQTKDEIDEQMKQVTEEEKEEVKRPENENAVKGELQVKASLKVYSAEEKVAELEGSIPYGIEEETGKLVDFSLTSLASISKGYIYANYAKDEKKKETQEVENKKPTTFELIYNAQVQDKILTKEMEIQVKGEKLVNSKEENSQVEAGKNIITKQIKIAEENFQKILGQEGKVEIYKGKELLGIIDSNTNKDEKNNYVLNIEDKKINDITIKTSAPITEGNLEVKVEKAFVEDISFKQEEIKKFDKMIVEANVKSNLVDEKLTQEIKLEEPVSKAEISIKEGKTNLSTIVVNKDVEMNVLLDTSDLQKALYKNPIIEIQMPSQVKKVEIKESNIVLDDELKIKSSKVVKNGDRQVIQIILEGTQTKYSFEGEVSQNNVVAKGANIILKTDITLDPLASSKKEAIEMYYTNENTNIYEQTVKNNEEDKKPAKISTNKASAEQEEKQIGLSTINVNIVAPTGVVAATSVDGYDEKNSNITNVGSDKKEAQIAIYQDKREVNVQGIVNNNYTNPIENVFILGRLPFKNNKQIDTTQSLGSNFDMPLKSEITVEGIEEEKVRVYYSTNGDATKDLVTGNNNWQEKLSDLSKAKSYLIVISGEVEASTQIKFNYKLELPANLPYNQSSYQTYKVYYDNKTEETTMGEEKVAGIVGFTTGSGPEVSIKLTTNIPKDKEESEDIRMIPSNGAARFWLEIKNTGKMEAKNAKIKIEKPNCTNVATYLPEESKYQAINDTIEIGNLAPGETREISYYLAANVKYDIEETQSTQVLLSADNVNGAIKSNEILFKIFHAELKIMNKTNTLESTTYTSNDVITYEIKLSDNQINSEVTITVPLPENATIVDAYWQEGGKTEGIERQKDKIIAKCVFIGSEKNLIVKFKVNDDTEKSFSSQVFAQIEEDGKIEDYYYSNEQYIYISKTDLTGKQEAPNKVYVRELEEFYYNFTLESSTKGRNTYIVLEDTLPEEITVLSTEIEIKDSEGTTPITEFEESQENNVLKIVIPYASAGDQINIKIKVKGKLKSKEDDGKEIVNKAVIYSEQVGKKQLNSITQYLEYNETAHKNPLTGGSSDNSSGNSSITRYKITGTAWLDKNKDGKKDEDEQKLAGIQVMLIYKSNNNIVKDVTSGQDKITTTDSNGQYQFNNLLSNEYLVVFLYDAGQYDITAYQVKDVGESYNSDAVNMQIILDGEKKYAGVTDTIKLNDANCRDIDIGLYESEKFDLKLEKYITKITLTTPTFGTQVNTYNDVNLRKIEVPAKDVGRSNFIVEYKIKVTNEGKIAGYAKKLVDYLPQNANFNSEINKNWYISGNNQNVYNTSLANEIIKPGESKEVSLVLTFNVTEKNIGNVVSNSAEIYESYNENGKIDYDSNEANKLESEDDMSNADIVLSVKTGNTMLYIGLTSAVIIILAIGIFEIKKRVINKK